MTAREKCEACKRREAASTPAGFRVVSLGVAGSYPDSLRLPLLGRVSVTAVTRRMRYRLAGHNRVFQTTDTVYVTKVRGQWKGLWKPETYAAYQAGRCPDCS